MSYKTASKYGMKNSTFETKGTGICERNIERVEIEADGNVIERVPEFAYLRKMISYSEKDNDTKLQGNWNKRYN